MAAAVEFRSVEKRFGDLRANDGISFRVDKGTIHGIIGENGAGKSTAMKMLYGMFPPDGGGIFIDGIERDWRSPFDAIHAGVGMVHQHFMLSGPDTVLDNIILGQEPGMPGLPIDRAAAREKILALAKRYGLDVPVDERVERVPVGVQQRIEILKALYRGAQILILDEPTAVLTPIETTQLLENLKSLKAEGKTILIITHKLKEVLSFTDHVTVFRQGRVSGGVATRDATLQSLADLMVGRKVNLRLDVAAGKPGETVLEARDLRARSGGVDRLKGVSLRVRAGEIVGVAGVEGNGQSELLQALLHPHEESARLSGSVHILGQDVCAFSTRHILDLGVGVIPEDRHHQGLLLGATVQENFILGQEERYSWYGWLRRSWIEAATERALEKFDVRPRNRRAIMRGLSGGNQQKVVAAREFERDPKILIAAQPTRGVDVGAIEFLHTQIVEARDRGVGVLLVSSELDEILELSDRILVMYGGRVVAEFARGQASEKEIGAAMGGHGSSPSPAGVAESARPSPSEGTKA